MEIRIPEKSIQLGIIHYLKTIGAVVGKTKTASVANRRTGQRYFDPYTFRGYPDLSCFYKNKMFFVEVKAKGNYQSKEQKAFQQLCIESGVDYILAYSIFDVQAYIEKR